MLNLKSLLKKEGIWYLFSLIALFTLIRVRRNIIMDTYIYVIIINVFIFLIPYVVLRMVKALRYYSYIAGVTFFVVWSIFYLWNIFRSGKINGCTTDLIQVEKYTPVGTSGKTSFSGVNVEYKGRTLNLGATLDTESLYETYGDSVINHIKVRLVVKETLPHVYYIDDVLMNCTN